MASLCKNLRSAGHGIGHRLFAMRTFSSNRTLLNNRPNLQVKTDAPLLGSRAFHNEPGLPFPKAAPANYLVQINSFSRLHKMKKIETGVFEAGGYKWKLKIYNQIFKGGDGETMPVTLTLSDTSALPENWEVDAVFSICLKNQNLGSYFSVIDRAHFDARKTECWSFIPRVNLTDPSYGYLKNDTCVLGAEVFVRRNELVTEIMSLKGVKPPPYKREFKIPNFPSLKEGGGWISHQTWTSEVFSAGGHKWMLKVSPKGWTKGIGRLSMYLENIVDSENDDASDEDSDDTSDQDSDDSSDTDSDDSSSDEDSDEDSLGCIKASYTMTLKSQHGDLVKSISSCRFSPSIGDQWGWPTFIDLASLHDPDRGFNMNGSIYLELELSVEEEDAVSN